MADLYALVDGSGVVRDVSPGQFPVAGLDWIACPAGCAVGWRVEGGVPVPPPSAGAAILYDAASAALARAKAEALAGVSLPYHSSEVDTWAAQVREAAAWSPDRPAQPGLLQSMVDASGGEWTLPDLVAAILANDSRWRINTGRILGWASARWRDLTELRAAVDAGAADVAELAAWVPGLPPEGV